MGFIQMKTNPYFIDDVPLQILFIDANIDSGRQFFNSALGTTWFDYDLHMTSTPEDAMRFIRPRDSKERALDLLFISNKSWTEGGKEYVKQIRTHDTLGNLPIYCIASCVKKLRTPNPQCMNKNWRLETSCNLDYLFAARPYKKYLAPDHPARLNDILCGNNISEQISSIINEMSRYWFNGEINRNNLP